MPIPKGGISIADLFRAGKKAVQTVDKAIETKVTNTTRKVKDRFDVAVNTKVAVNDKVFTPGKYHPGSYTPPKVTPGHVNIDGNWPSVSVKTQGDSTSVTFKAGHLNKFDVKIPEISAPKITMPKKDADKWDFFTFTPPEKK
jgi:hypothetical protein